jgi:hypothetical protein
LHLAAGAAVLRIAKAQAYPTRPVRIIVGFPPGGATDIMARLIGQWLSDRLGQPFVIENRPGAAGNIGTAVVVNAPPDGYTLLVATSVNAINATLYDKLNFNLIRDIAPVASLHREPQIMEVNPSVPFKTVPEFISHAKANPGKLNMASSGIGTPSHVAGELFKMMTGVSMFHVPYRGAAALVDLLSGQGKRPHCFPRSADRIGASVRSASRYPGSGSGREAPGKALQRVSRGGLGVGCSQARKTRPRPARRRLPGHPGAAAARLSRGSRFQYPAMCSPGP